MKAVTLADHSSTFYSFIVSKVYVPAISSDTITRYLYVEKKYINLLFANSLTQPNFLPFFVRGLCCKPHINRNWQILCASFHNSGKYNASNNRHKAICLANRGGFYGHDNCLVCKQHVLSFVLSMREMTYHPSDDNSFSIWNLLISSIQMHKLSTMKGSKRGAIQHCLPPAPNVSSNLHALSQSSLILY